MVVYFTSIYSALKYAVKHINCPTSVLICKCIENVFNCSAHCILFTNTCFMLTRDSVDKYFIVSGQNHTERELRSTFSRPQNVHYATDGEKH